MLAILILAAGASSRMRGRDKLLEEIDGVAQLRRIADAALATGAPVYVTLPPDRPLRAAALAGCAVRIVEVPDAAEGMGASLRAGVAALDDGLAGVMVVLADLVEVTADDLAALGAAWDSARDAVWRATAQDGRHGHPVNFPARLFGALAQVSGDSGARAVYAAEGARTRHLPLPGARATTDLDTPEDWAAWRAASGRE